MEMIKVLFFTPSATGGAERMTINIAKMLPLDKFESRMIIASPTLGTIVDFIPPYMKVIHMPLRSIIDFPIIRMIRLIRKEKPQFVFCSLMYLSIRLLIASKICGVKVIVRNNNTISTLDGITRFMLRKTYSWADKVICQQDEMRVEVMTCLNLRQDKVITLQNPIDTQLIEEKLSESSPYPADEVGLKYVWVARFLYQKGQDILVRAFKKVHESLPDAKLYLVGKYDFNKEYDRQVKDYVVNNGLSDAVQFVGFDSNPYKWVKHSDVYVMPSRLEGLPNSLIDAMYIGKPVVATLCIPVISRIVEDGYNGFVVPSEDVDALADAMLKAPKLKDFKMTYKGASKEDFIRLFEVDSI